MSHTDQRYEEAYDLSNCTLEPLKFIRSCQHGATIIVLYADTLRIKAISQNSAERLSQPLETYLGADAGAVIRGDALAALQNIGPDTDLTEINPLELLTVDEGEYRRENLIVHQQDDLLIVEIEPRDEAYGSTQFLMRMDKAIARIQASSGTGADIFATTAREVRALTGYDRVYVYQFDEEYNGTVIAEAKRAELVSYHQLRFPHTDIPKQARDLYLSQQIRQVTDTREDSDSILISDNGNPVNLSKASNRGVSPIHLQYLRNISVGASMSIAITVDGRLWGLIGCHHHEHRLVDYRLRQLLGLFGRILSGHLALSESSAYRSKILSTTVMRAELVEKMKAGDDLVAPLRNGERQLLHMMEASGAALVFNKELVCIGDCPAKEEVAELVSLVASKRENIYACDHLHAVHPPSANFRSAPAGLVSIRISPSPGEYIIWFRPEITKTITWGGDPKLRKEIIDGKVRLHPNMSFERYTQTVRGKSKPWERYHLDNALAFRNDIKEIILYRFQELRNVNSRLTEAYEEMESFSYSVSHDLRAPLRHIKGYSEILLEDYGEKLDDYGQAALNIIMESVGKMNDFINALLRFSRLGQQTISTEATNLNELLQEIWGSLAPGGNIELRTSLDTETIRGDRTLLWQVFLNLLSNAVKYQRKEVESWVAVSSHTEGDVQLITVEDNGIGFDKKHANDIFQVFHRLVAEDEFEGTGIGLAIVHRIVTKHRGTITVDSEPGRGTKFTITLPVGDIEPRAESGERTKERTSPPAFR